MKTQFLITGAAVAALVAGGASATIHKSHHKVTSVGMYAAPSQPIPYAQLDNYLAAKPSERASMGDNGAPMGSSPAPQASDTNMSPPASTNAEPAPGASDQAGSQPSGGVNGMTGSSGAPPATGDTGAAMAPPAPATDQAAPDGSSVPPEVTTFWRSKRSGGTPAVQASALDRRGVARASVHDTRRLSRELLELYTVRDQAVGA